MKEGRDTEAGEQKARARANVVRLPRDWLGPREELVPFGRRAAPPEVGGEGVASAELPPSAEDFWGERSAAIHGVVQASVDTVVPEFPLGRESSAVARRFRFGRRCLAPVSIVTAIVAAAAGVAALSAGPVHRVTSGPSLNMAAILSNDVSRMLRIGSPRITSTKPVSRPHIQPVRHVLHRVPHTSPTPRTTERPSKPPLPPPTYAPGASTTNASPSYQSNRPPATPPTNTSQQAGPSRVSGASVRPTGEFGAIGPVSSPNG